VKAPGKTLLGYPDRVSAAPGETVRFMVSSEDGRPYDASLLRIRCGDRTPGGAGWKVEPVPSPVDGRHAGRPQAMRMGSWARVPGPLPAIDSFTLQAILWPTTPAKGWQGLIGWWSEPTECGFGLFIDDKGQVLGAVGDGKGGLDLVRSGKPLVAKVWTFVALVRDHAAGTLTLHQWPMERLGRLDLDATVTVPATARPGRPDVPLTMATIVTAKDGAVTPGAHFNGRLDSPRLAERALDRAGIEALVAWPPPAALAPAVLAAWDFGLDIPTLAIRDRSPHGRDGELVNLPTRAVPGFNWTGAVHDWTKAPGQYGAIHFHDDDVYDAGWEADLELAVPPGTRSGLYAMRLANEGDESFLAFVVRPPRGQATAPVAFLASTATYTAYIAIQWDVLNQASEMRMGGLAVLGRDAMHLYAHPELGLSAYDTHGDGSPVYYGTRLRPAFNWAPGTGLWSFNADTHVTDWLEGQGHAYDAITDDDLHAEGLDLLARYRVIVTGAHPEYWTTPMWQAMTAYLEQGGRLMYLGGNGFYWRIAMSPAVPGVVEVRRAETGARYWAAEPGAYYHSLTGELGGLWRRVGCPPNRLVGIGTVATGFDRSSYYRLTPEARDPRVAFIAEGVGAEERIGDFGILGGAAGYELDAANRDLGTPPHAVVVARSEAHSYYYLLVPDEIMFNTPAVSGLENPGVRAEATFFETPHGGGVFSTGSITWAASLAHNGYANNVSRMTGNVLRRFLDPAPL